MPAQPLHQLGAMTQGQLGGVLARAIDRHVRCRRPPSRVVTHVQVDPSDPAFDHPTKPIGPFFTAEQAASSPAERGWRVVEDAGRGLPPRGSLALARSASSRSQAIRTLLDAGHVVLAAGGGGIAVTPSRDGTLAGVDAVIDKDLAAAALATAVGAERAVPAHRCRLPSCSTTARRSSGRCTVLTADEAARHLAQGQFPAGSMGPKVTAALHFLRERRAAGRHHLRRPAGRCRRRRRARRRHPHRAGRRCRRGERRHDRPRACACTPAPTSDSLLLMSATVTMERVRRCGVGRRRDGDPARAGGSRGRRLRRRRAERRRTRTTWCSPSAADDEEAVRGRAGRRAGEAAFAERERQPTGTGGSATRRARRGRAPPTATSTSPSSPCPASTPRWRPTTP